MLEVYIDASSHTKKDGVKCNFFSFQALFVRGATPAGVQRRPSVFTILHFYEVYLPLISVKLVSSAHLPMRSSMLHLLLDVVSDFF